METLPDTSYDAALEKLNLLIHRTDSEPTPDSKKIWESHFENTFKHVKILELEEPLKRMSIIHIAGTKGKISREVQRQSQVLRLQREHGIGVVRDVEMRLQCWKFRNMEKFVDLIAPF